MMKMRILYPSYHFAELHTHINHDQALPVGRTVVHSSGLGDIGAYATFNAAAAATSSKS